MTTDTVYMLKTILREIQEAHVSLSDLRSIIAEHTKNFHCDVEWEDLQFLVSEIESRLARVETTLREAAYQEALAS
jgi:hypothetical protein